MFGSRRQESARAGREKQVCGSWLGWWAGRFETDDRGVADAGSLPQVGYRCAHSINLGKEK